MDSFSSSANSKQVTHQNILYIKVSFCNQHSFFCQFTAASSNKRNLDSRSTPSQIHVEQYGESVDFVTEGLKIKDAQPDSV